MRYCFLFVFVIIGKMGIPQPNGEGQVVGKFSKFNPIPSSPNVAAMEKYGNLPVNPNTGIPQISIPVHTIRLNGFSWPVQLSYHAGGFKSTDIATRNGLGWTLQASGVVSIPSFAGVPISVNPGELNLNFTCNPVPSPSPYCDPVNSWDINYVNGAIAGVYNPAPEVYNLNTANGIGLKFINGATLPASDYKINAVNAARTQWILLDMEGNKYEFMILGQNARTSVCQGMQNTSLPQSANLSRITTINGQTIDFIYDTEEYDYQLPPLHIKKWLNPGQFQQCNAQYDNVDYYCTNSFHAIEKRLSAIQSSTGEVVRFFYSARTDLPGSAKMDRIECRYERGAVNNLVKSVNFAYSYFGTGTSPNTLQLKLNEIEVKGSDGTANGNKYTFTYNTSLSLPAKTDQVIIFSGNAMTGYNISKAGILEKIEYPTGGSTEFDYDVMSQYGTLRVKKITDYSSPGVQADVKTYEYAGEWNATAVPEFMESETVYYFGIPQPPSCVAGHLPCQAPQDWLQACNATTWKSEPVVYPGDEFADNTVRYTLVTEKFGLNGENGKTEYSYALPSTSRDVYDINYLNADYLIEKRSFKSNSDGTFTIVQKTTNEYQVPTAGNGFWGPDQHPRERREYTRKIFMTRPQMTLPCCNGYVETYTSFPPLYEQISRRVASVPVFLNKKTETVYNNAIPVTTETRYFYDDALYLQPSRIETFNSKSDLLQTTLRYPYSVPAAPVYTEMLNRNMISSQVEQTVRNVTANKELSKEIIDYIFWSGSSFIRPGTFQNSVGGNIPETEFSINNYDIKGNILQVTDKSGIVTSYLWGYNSRYPVAKIVNANYVTAQGYITQSILDNAEGGTDDNALRTHLGNLRNIAGALVTVFTVKPMVGITSETDANGRTIYYEYDNFNRLTIIRDKDNNIIKKFCYNYAGQPENCNSPCTNTTANWQNTATPPTCQQGSCGYTGYQLQEQRDMNTCSPTYNQTQNVLVYNPAACAPASGINITYQNTTGISGFTAVYTNLTTLQQYSFTVPASGTGVLGCLPAGTYSLNISKPGNNAFLEFGTGCSIISGTSAFFRKGVQVGPPGNCNMVTIGVSF